MRFYLDVSKVSATTLLFSLKPATPHAALTEIPRSGDSYEIRRNCLLASKLSTLWREGAMQRPIFHVRQSDDGSGFVIDAVWAGPEIEQLLGVYETSEDAWRWVREHSKTYIQDAIIAGKK
jgi:hypothetical protein